MGSSAAGKRGGRIWVGLLGAAWAGPAAAEHMPWGLGHPILPDVLALVFGDSVRIAEVVALTIALACIFALSNRLNLAQRSLRTRMEQTTALLEISRAQAADRPIGDTFEIMGRQLLGLFLFRRGVRVRFEWEGERVTVGAEGRLRNRVRRAIRGSRGRLGWLEVAITDRWPARVEAEFLPEEETFIGLVARQAGVFLERHRASRELMMREAQLQTVAQTIPDVLYVSNLGEFRALYISPGVLRMLGVSDDEYLERPNSWKELLHEDDRSRVLDSLARKLAAGATELEDRYRIWTWDRSGYVWVQDRARVVRGRYGMPDLIYGVMTDITGLVEARDALERSRRELREITQAVPEMLYRARALGMRATFVSEAVGPMLGYSPREFLAVPDIWRRQVHDDDRAKVVCTVKDALASGAEGFEVEYRIWTRDRGELKWFRDRARIRRNAAGKAVEVFGIVSDVTQRKRTEEALRRSYDDLALAHDQLKDMHRHLLQSEKMASIGQLAAGVAHEINNPVGYVKSNLATLSEYLERTDPLLAAWEVVGAEGGAAIEEIRRMLEAWAPGEVAEMRRDLAEMLQECRDGVARVERIVRDLRQFSHRGADEFETTDLNERIGTVLNIVRNEIKYKAEVVLELGELPEVECFPARLDQLFLNLLMNAAQAIETRGRIIVRTRRDGSDAVVEIEDNGCGIPEEVLPRIFDPFFTTKPVGEGTGLGLAIAFSIVERHGGTIGVASQPGLGTRFTLRIPIHASEDHARTIICTLPNPTHPSPEPLAPAGTRIPESYVEASLK